MALVLALEPDLRQAAILKRVITERVHADLIVVDSRDAAIEALTARVPDVILLTALLSPRDEDELIAHLRTLPGADHVQTHTIPQLASSKAAPETESSGLLKRFRKKKSAPLHGCDPGSFAEEVGTFVARAEELKAQAGPSQVSRIAPSTPLVDFSAFDDVGAADAGDAAGSAWASPFEWKRPDASAVSDTGPARPRREKPRRPLVSATPIAVIAEAAEQQQELDARLGVLAKGLERAGVGALDPRPAGNDADAAAEEHDRQWREADAAERERLRLAAEAEWQRIEQEEAAERERLRLEAEAVEREQLRVAAEAERVRLEAEAAFQREALRLEAEAERERVRLAAEAAERERIRLAAEAAERERQRLEAEAAAERERLRVAAEAAERERLRVAAEKERLRLAAVAAEQERLRIAAEAAERERLRIAAEAAERERLRLVAEAAERERLRLVAEALERERVRLAAEAAERERARLAAETAKREKARLEAEAAAERERLHLAAEAAKREKARLEAEAAAERERLRLAAETAKREKARLEAAAAAERERLHLAAEAAKHERARLEAEAAAARERLRRDEANPMADDAIVHDGRGGRYGGTDAFADFRLEADERRRSLLSLLPMAFWAPREAPKKSAQAAAGDPLRDLIAGLSLPHVAGVRYATGCRIRRVRVPVEAPPRARGARPVIVSRRVLDDARGRQDRAE